MVAHVLFFPFVSLAGDKRDTPKQDQKPCFLHQKYIEFLLFSSIGGSNLELDTIDYQ
jgi:hypothetical protein